MCVCVYRGQIADEKKKKARKHVEVEETRVKAKILHL